MSKGSAALVAQSRARSVSRRSGSVTGSVSLTGSVSVSVTEYRHPNGTRTVSRTEYRHTV
jgi:hypothetical protein